jgi:hypothetical protein
MWQGVAQTIRWPGPKPIILALFATPLLLLRPPSLPAMPHGVHRDVSMLAPSLCFTHIISLTDVGSASAGSLFIQREHQVQHVVGQRDMQVRGASFQWITRRSNGNNLHQLSVFSLS